MLTEQSVGLLSTMYFAELDKNNMVKRVIVADSLDWCVKNLGGTWVQTYANDPIKNYAGIGHTYDAGKDTFIALQPFPSYVLDPKNVWIPPVPIPANVELMQWDEATVSFIPRVNTVIS